MGKASRDKGARAELSAVHLLQEHGIAAEKIPLSGAVGGRFAGDISMPVLGDDRTLECKVRKSGFRQVYWWLTGNYGVVIKADRSEPLICIRLSDFAKLCIAADKGRDAA